MGICMPRDLSFSWGFHASRHVSHAARDEIHAIDLGDSRLKCLSHACDRATRLLAAKLFRYVMGSCAAGCVYSCRIPSRCRSALHLDVEQRGRKEDIKFRVASFGQWPFDVRDL